MKPSKKTQATAVAEPMFEVARKPKVSLGAIQTKKAAEKTYPILPDTDGEVAKLVHLIIAQVAQLETLEGSVAINKAELRSRALPFYYQNSHGKLDVQSSIACMARDEEVLVCFTEKLKQVPDDTGLRPILGKAFDRYFADTFEIKIDGEKVPESKAQVLVNELQELFKKHGCLDALAAKTLVKPRATYFAERHTKLPLETLLDIEKVAPSVVAVKTKGRK